MDLEQKILSRTAHFRVPSGKSAEEALTAFKSAAGDMSRKSAVVYINRTRRLIFRSSAVAAAGLILFGFWALFLHIPETKVVAEKGTHLDLSLPDGSHVTINADSKIAYNKKGFTAKRELILDGEAFFDVTRGNSFIISTSNASIKVLGTSFNVYSRGDNFRVSCVTGRIAVSSGNKSVEITPGQSAALSGKELFSYQDKNLVSSTGWIKGEFYFENSPLKVIFSEIERQFNVKFAVGEMKEKYFTGSFTNKDLKNTLEIVCIPMGLIYEVGDNGKIFITEEMQ
jgi:transmembrane sensor